MPTLRYGLISLSTNIISLFYLISLLIFVTTTKDGCFSFCISRWLGFRLILHCRPPSMIRRFAPLNSSEYHLRCSCLHAQHCLLRCCKNCRKPTIASSTKGFLLETLFFGIDAGQHHHAPYGAVHPVSSLLIMGLSQITRVRGGSSSACLPSSISCFFVGSEASIWFIMNSRRIYG